MIEPMTSTALQAGDRCAIIHNGRRVREVRIITVNDDGTALVHVLYGPQRGYRYNVSADQLEVIR